MSNQRKPQHGPVGGGPMSGLIRGTEKARDFKGTFSMLFHRLSKYYRIFILVFVLSIAGNVFSIIGPKILGQATTNLYEGSIAKINGTGLIDFEAIGKILLFALALYLASALCGYIQGWVMTKVSNTLSYEFRRDISQKINRLPIKYFDITPNGEIMSRLTNDVDTLSQSLSQNLNQIISSVITLIGVLYMMFTISVTMTLVTLAVIPFSLVFTLIIVKFSQKQFFKQQSMLGKLNGHIEEMYGGHTIIKAFNAEEKSLETFDLYNDELYSSAWKSQFLSGTIQPVMMFIGNLGYVVVCLLGGIFASQGKITVGDIQAFIQYVRSFQQPISQTAQISNQLQSMMAAAERVFDFLNEEQETIDTANSVTIKEINGKVSFKNVNFEYEKQQSVIHDLNISIAAGKRVAIVGPTGAGKTTIVKLLMRFYDVSSGSILIDDKDIRDFKRVDLRSLFGMVLQDTWLFNGTISENIKYSKQDATLDDIIAASKAAHVDHFVRTLPNGYDFVLNEEANNISAGQKQLITIARAFLADPKILILDEATSSVDTRTETLIQSAMDRLMANRTCFIIAHRLSTIRNADIILVINHGNIIETGNHKQLMKQNGFYAQLYNSQFNR